MGFLSKAISASYGDNTVTIIPAGARISGDLLIDGPLHIDGDYEGLLDAQGELMVSKSGRFKGRARAKVVTLSGSFDGELHCESLSLINGGVFRGRVYCEQFHLDDRAQFLGERLYPGAEAQSIEEARELLDQPVPDAPELTLDNLLDSLPSQVSLNKE